jgi:hypothetical protein
MSNSTRNTIVLGIILLLITSFWLYQFISMTRKTAQIIEHNRITAASVDSLRQELSVIDSLKAEYILQEALMNQQSKIIIGEDSPTITYSYLLNILDWAKLNLRYDFAAADTTNTIEKYTEYILSGRSKYTNLLHMANQLEKQRTVITIEDLAIASESAAQADTVTFSMVLHTHYREGGPAMTDLSMRPLQPPYTGYALFRPRISEEILPFDIDPSLISVEDVKLIGMSRGMAFFRDTQGIIHILSKGSRVAYGYLYRIDESAGKVIFRLNKFGLEEDFVVTINKNQ